MKDNEDLTDEEAIELLTRVINYLTKKTKTKKKSKNKKTSTKTVNIFSNNDEKKLKEYLNNLDLNALKKIISSNGLDKGRITKNWKNKDKLIDFIITQKNILLNKGAVFYDKKKDKT